MIVIFIETIHDAQQKQKETEKSRRGHSGPDPYCDI